MRRRRAPKRKILPDPRYKNLLVSKFMNIIMRQGKKSVAESIIYGAFDVLKEQTKKDALEVFKQAIENARPLLETKSRRVGGATYQVPVEVKPERGQTLALRWIRDYCRGKRGKPMRQKLAEELLDCYNKTGTTIKKREDTHKMAEANRAFSHYRW
ncbi:MAG: 30S ribosomal protein S7 [Candidatus Omnitrophica bacterium]|nr:30S ribosomal protein S7 [Candidatus Omnitrophota bacterium]